MAQKKTELQKFQTEYMAAKKAFEEAEKKLKDESDIITTLLNDRSTAYNSYKRIAKDKYVVRQLAAQNGQTSAGWFGGIFGSS